MPQLVLPGLAAAIGTTIGVLLARPLLIRHVLDSPNQRSSHVVPTARAGGLGVLVGLLAGLFVGSSEFPSQRGPLVFAVALTLFALLGFIEDVRSLPVRVRLLGQVALATGCAVAVRITTLNDLSRLSSLSLATGVGLICVFYVNAANFMDGVNGISGLHGLVAGGYFSMIGHWVSSPTLAICGLVVSVAFAAFLPWNLLGPGLFLGDVGSYLLGASIWLMAAGSLILDISPIVALAPLFIYSLDVIATLWRRLTARANLFSPHREHTYQQIQQLTGSHVAAALVCTTGTLVCSCAGWLTTKGLPDVAGAIVIGLVGLIYVGLPTALRRLSLGKSAA